MLATTVTIYFSYLRYILLYNFIIFLIKVPLAKISRLLRKYNAFYEDAL
jgi:hypothetical protein